MLKCKTYYRVFGVVLLTSVIENKKMNKNCINGHKWENERRRKSREIN